MNFKIASVYGTKERSPLVQVQIDDNEPFQMRTKEAIKIAFDLLHAAEAAISDAFIFEFASRSLGGDRNGAILLQEYRKWREGVDLDL